MSMLENLRPEIRPLDAEWSAETLQAILAEPRGTGRPARRVVDRPRRRTRLAVGLVAAATVTCVGMLGPLGSPGTPAAAAQLTAAHLSIHPEVGEDEFLHIRKIERHWGYGGAGVESPFTLEYWVPGDGESEWIERSGFPGTVEPHAFHDWGPQIYVDHSSDPSVLLDELRDYAESQGESTDLHGLWTVAFWIAMDPVAPQSFKDEVMQALSTAEGVDVADPDFRVAGLSGEALRIPGHNDPWFVVAPGTSAFRGIVGHPEKDKGWVGPEPPMWTITMEYDVTSTAP